MRTSRMAAPIPSFSERRSASSMVRQACTSAPASSRTSSRSIKSKKSSSTISNLAPARARFEPELSELSMLFLRQWQLDSAHETLRPKLAPHNCAGDPLFNQVTSQAVVLGLLHPRSACLLPDNAEVVLAVPGYLPPGHVHFSVAARQRAVLGCIRGELMQDKAKRRCQISRENNPRPFDVDSIGTVSRVCLELDPCQRLQVRPLPVRLHQQAMGARHGREPTAKALDKLFRRRAASERLVCDRLHDRQGILDPMCQLAEQELLTGLQHLALGDVAGAFQHESPAVHGFQIELRFHRQHSSVLGAVLKLTAPASGGHELLLQRRKR